MNSQKIQTLGDFLADHAICRTWYVSQGSPTGCRLVLNLEDEGEDYCDSQALLEQRQIRDAIDLEGEVTQDSDGEWRWDVCSLADSDLRDDFGSTVFNLAVWAN